MPKIDLHIHSSYSDDGELSPEKIITKCKEQNMELTAITDHNSVRGVAEARKAAGDLRLLTGVELDCTYEGWNFHLLGYGFDHTHQQFAKVEQDILEQEQKAAKEKIQLFREFSGIPIDTDEVLARAENGVVSGELIAEIVLALEDAAKYEILVPYLPGGVKSDMPNVRFYWDFFAKGKPAYVPIQYLSLRDAAYLIHNAGGVTVLAHPGQNLTRNDTLLPGILSEAIDGIEVFSSYHSRETAEYYLEVAGKHHLFVTCGSDFHGKHRPDICLGGHRAFWEDNRIRNGLVNLFF